MKERNDFAVDNVTATCEHGGGQAITHRTPTMKSAPAVPNKFLWVLGLLIAVAARADECSTSVIGVDVTHGQASEGDFLGHCVGQSFVTQDTLLRSLTVWRVPIQAGSLIGMKPYIKELDSLGVPRLDRTVYVGETLVNASNDTINPAMFRWEMDPPIALPHRGGYAFFLGQDPCLAYFDILAASHDVELYPQGTAWVTARTRACVPELTSIERRPTDLIFLLEFCRTGITGAKTHSWGQLKLLYR